MAFGLPHHFEFVLILHIAGIKTQTYIRMLQVLGKLHGFHHDVITNEGLQWFTVITQISNPPIYYFLFRCTNVSSNLQYHYFGDNHSN